MSKWLVNLMGKEARRFRADDEVRYFTHPRKGLGEGIVMTPSFRRGRVVDYDAVLRRYKVRDNQNNEEIMVHPRNLMPSYISRNTQPQMQEVPSESPETLSPEPAIMVAQRS